MDTSGRTDVDWLLSAFEWVVRMLEVAGVAAILLGAIRATVGYVHRRLGGQGAPDDFREFRSAMGRSILIGLEFLVAADIVRTITTELSPQSLLSLGALILIRTLLSLALEVEIEGVWPWQRRAKADERGKVP
jgi:uncharacterized membrane protein